MRVDMNLRTRSKNLSLTTLNTPVSKLPCFVLPRHPAIVEKPLIHLVPDSRTGILSNVTVVDGKIDIDGL